MAHREMAARAWAALGGDPALLDRVEVRGAAPDLLPSVWPALPAVVAAVSCSTLAAAVLDAARSGHAPAPVTVDAGHVAVAARSERYARAGDGGAPDLFAPLSRSWETADGWLRLHANYPWHRERALRVLGLPDAATPDDVAAAVRRRPGDELEEALAAAGALGSVVRTVAQWGAHPQGRVVAARPLVERDPMAGAARGPAPGRAAAGLRVLDLTRVIAGPVATRTLAAWGADVLRVDSPRLPEIPAQAVDTLPGKRSALLDLAEPSGRAQLEELLAGADVLVQGYRPGALARHGLGADELAGRHPHLSTVTLSAWGAAGPWAGRRGFDSLVQCSTGIAAAEGSGGRPGALPAQVLDHATGYLAAAAALLALADVARGGPASAARLSLAQTAAWLTAGGPGPAAGPERAADPAPWLVELPGAAEPVRVVGPPGRVGDLAPRWRATSDHGAAAPSWSARPDGRCRTGKHRHHDRVDCGCGHSPRTSV